MLQNRDLVMFGNDWNRFPSPLQHIAMRLAENNRILWIGSVGLRRPRFRLYDVRRIAERFIKILFADRAKTGTSTVVVMHPFIVPFYDSHRVRVFNDAILRKTIQRKVGELKFRDIIVCSFTPLVSGVVGTLGETSSHYFCVDDYSQFDGAYESVRMLEEEILKKVDSCFAVSEPLVQTRIAKHGENHFLPQGVDTDHFRPLEEPPPPDLASVKKPIVGFFGQLASYVDIDLIVRCANAYPKVSFVIIGRPMVDVSGLSQAPNIVYVGEVPYEVLPRYARVFDVGLNPRIVNELTKAMNPMKVMEYLSLGIPIVSTESPEVRKFGDLINVAESSEHFIELVGTALADKSLERRRARRQLADRFSWNAVTAQVSDVIERIDDMRLQP